MAADELKVCAFGAPNRIAKPKAANATVKVIIVFISPPKLKVCTTLRIVEIHLNQKGTRSQVQTP